MHPDTELRLDRLLRSVQGAPQPKVEADEYVKMAVFIGVDVLVVPPLIGCVLVSYTLAGAR